MPAIREIFTAHGPGYLDRFGSKVPHEHRKVIQAITNCRTVHYGLSVYDCQACGGRHTVYRSCGNRHCPVCQNHKARAWLDRQLQRQVPTHHFLITFTVPEELRACIRSHQRLCYEALFKASSSSLKTLAAEKRFVGGDVPGFFGVLHTWGRQLSYHPHIHYVVPGGAYFTRDRSWHASRRDFFVPVRALSVIFKARFRDEMKKAGLYHQIPATVWEQPWNVNSRAVGHAGHATRYLAPYVFKVAISDSRIVNVSGGTVTFRYKKPGSERWRNMTLDAAEFIRRFLQHVLPTGFMKVRYYGFLHASATHTRERIVLAIEIAQAFVVPARREDKPETPPAPVCPACGGRLVYRFSILPHMMLLPVDTS